MALYTCKSLYYYTQQKKATRNMAGTTTNATGNDAMQELITDVIEEDAESSLVQRCVDAYNDAVSGGGLMKAYTIAASMSDEEVRTLFDMHPSIAEHLELSRPASPASSTSSHSSYKTQDGDTSLFT